MLLIGWTHLLGRGAAFLAVAAVVLALLGPGAWSLATAATTNSGAIPSAGPAGTGFVGLGGFGPDAAAAPPGAFGGLAGATAAGPGGPGATRGLGGLLNGSTPSADLTAALEAGATRYTWVAATVRSNEAAGYQLATGRPVMAIGGFNGTDPAPTLAGFEELVAEGRIHYFVEGGSGGAGGSTAQSTASQITFWVESHFTSVSIGGVTLYDLTSPTT